MRLNLEESIKLGDIYTLVFEFSIGATTFSMTRHLLQKKSSPKENNNLEDSVNSSDNTSGNENIEYGNNGRNEIQKEAGKKEIK
ncbi:MAG: hypothetical protein L0H53_12240 [Candidatus Nitrosocosmicus sp.]|nr:hypothetical protein [Candidatus Nitrosocosmicus sp.]